MNTNMLTQAPVAKAAMLIRKPIAEVFNAFIDPAITTQFWFTKSSGRLEPGKPVNRFSGIGRCITRLHR